MMKELFDKYSDDDYDIFVINIILIAIIFLLESKK